LLIAFSFDSFIVFSYCCVQISARSSFLAAGQQKFAAIDSGAMTLWERE